MVDYISQSERELKHMSFLRRVFLQKMTGVLHIQFSVEKTSVLYFHKGDLVGDASDSSLVLSKYLSDYVQKFAWEPRSTDVKYGWVAPWIAVSEALKNIDIEAKRLIIYHHAFSKLPHMILKNCPIHRFNFVDESSYLYLYKLSLGSPSFKPEIFLTGELSKDELIKRVRTMLLIFLLGYLKPAPKGSVNNTRKSNFASRILNRLRAKGV